MGLAASQSRLLSLTSRMHDLEYKSQKLEAQKLQMANKSQAIYSEYSDALNKTQIQFKTIGSDGNTKYQPVKLADMVTAGYKFKVFNQTTKAWEEKTTAADVLTAAGVTTDDASTITNLVNAGVLVFEKPTQKDASGTQQYEDVNVGTDTNLQEVSDETDLKKAEAKYEADLAKIDAKDKKFDTDIASVENERNAIKTEIDTLKTVAKDNVERTFKLFG